MAEISHLYASQTALSNDTMTTTAVFQEPSNTCSISGAFLTASTNYLLIAKGRINGSTTGGHISIRVSTADDTDIASLSESKWEPGPANYATSAKMAPWMFVRSFATDASPADVKIEVARSDTSGTIYVDQLSLILIDLDDVGSSNYIEATYDTVGDLVGGVDMATISTLTASTEYLFLGYGRVDANDTVNYHSIDLYDGSTQKTAAALTGEDDREFRAFGVMGAWTTASTPNDAKIVGTGENTGSADSNGSYLIAIKTSAFDDFEYAFAATGELLTAATDTTVETIASYSPSSQGHHLVLGRVNITAQGNVGASVEVAGINVLTGDITPKTFLFDTTDTPNVEVVGVAEVATTSDVDLIVNADAAETTAYEFVAIVRLEALATDVTAWGMIPIGI